MPYSNAGGGGTVTSPVATDPLSFTGVVTFDNAANTPVTAADGVISPSLAAPVGSAQAVSATAPAATTGASQIGKAVTVVASSAVASTDTAGAAAGGSVTITAGNAARLTSGNANGGDISLVTGAGIGTGTTGQVTIGNSGTKARPGFGFAAGASVGTGIYSRSNATLDFTTSGVDQLEIVSGVLIATSPTQYGWSSATDVGSAADTGLARTAAGVIKATNGSTGNGWLQQSAARSRVNADVTNATTTPGNITGLSATLIAGRKYTGELVVFCTDDVAADGISFDFDGGTATMTSFAAQGTIADTVSVRNLARSAALATDIVDAVTTGSALVKINFSLVVNAAGTFIPRFFQTAHTTGTATVTLGSYMWLEDMP